MKKLISINKDWPIRVALHKVFYRKAFPLTELDIIILSFLQINNDVIEYKRLGGLLGFAIEENLEKQIYYDPAEQAIFSALLDGLTRYHLIFTDHGKNGIPVISTTPWGKDALNSGTKYLFYEGISTIHDHNSIFHNETIETIFRFCDFGIYSKVAKPEEVKPFQFDSVEQQTNLYLSKGLVNASEEDRTLEFQWIDKDALGYSQFKADITLTLLEGQGDFKIATSLNNVSSPELDDIIQSEPNHLIFLDWLLLLRYEFYKKHSQAIKANELIEYLRHVDWLEILSDTRIVWNKEIFELLSRQEIATNSIWKAIIHHCPEEIIIEHISSYYGNWDWVDLSKKLNKPFIFSNVNLYPWDFDVILERLEQKELEVLLLSIADVGFITDWKTVTQKISFDFIEANIQKLPFDLYSIVRSDEPKVRNTLLNNLEAPWDWSYITDKWPIDFVLTNIKQLSPHLHLNILLNRILKNFDEFIASFENQGFNEYFASSKESLNINIGSSQDVVLNSTTMQFLASNKLLYWGIDKIPGVEINTNLKWTVEIFSEYGNSVKTISGYDRVSESIEFIEDILNKPSFPWNFDIISCRTDLNWSIDFITNFKEHINCYSALKSVPAALVIENFTFFLSWCKEKQLLEKFSLYVSEQFTYRQIENNSKHLQDNKISVNWNTILKKEESTEILHALKLRSDTITSELPSAANFIEEMSVRCDVDFILENPGFSWDWMLITSKRLPKELLLEEEFQIEYSAYIYWPFIIDQYYSASDLAPDNKLASIALLLLQSNEPVRIEAWQIITKKIPPNSLWTYIRKTKSLEIFHWDWDYISSSKYIPIDHQFLSTYSSKINWKLLSRNNSLSYFFQYSKEVYTETKQWVDRTLQYLYAYEKEWDFKELSRINNLTWHEKIIAEFQERWDWHELSSVSALLTKPNKEKGISQFDERRLKRFAKFIDWPALSGRFDITISTELVTTFKSQAWDWALLSSHPKFEITTEFLTKNPYHPWDFKALSNHKLLNFTKEVVIELQDKDWDFRAFSRAKWIDNDLILQLNNKSWDWEQLSKNSNLIFDINLITIFAQKDNPDWSSILSSKTLHITTETVALLFSKRILKEQQWNNLSLHNNLDFNQNPNLLAKYRQYWDWKILIQNNKIDIADIDILRKYKDNIDWDLLCNNENFNPKPDILANFTSLLNWKLISKKLTLDLDILKSFQENLDWEYISQNTSIRFTVELIDQFRDYWDYYYLKTNPALSLTLRQHVLHTIEKIPELELYLNLKSQGSNWAGYIYHFTHITNAITIIKNKKILSRQKATGFADAAGSVVGRRHTAHEFARFYFRPQTPTQFYNENLGKDANSGYMKRWSYYDGFQMVHNQKWFSYFDQAYRLGLPKCPIPIFFRFNLQEIILKMRNKCYMSNGNMQTNWAEVNKVQKMLSKFNFADIYSSFSDTSDGDWHTYLNFSQQEFLIKDEFDFSDLTNYDIIVGTEEDKKQLILSLNDQPTLKNKVLVDSIETNIFHHGNKKINYSYEEQILKISTDYVGDRKHTDKIILEFHHEAHYKFISGNVQKVSGNRIEAYQEVELYIDLEVPFTVSFYDDFKKAKWQILKNPGSSYTTNEVSEIDRSNLQEWWNGLSFQWKKYLYINYLLSTRNKYARLTFLCDDSYGPEFLICKCLKLESQSPDDDIRNLNKYITEKTETISKDTLIGINKLNELLLQNVQNLEPLLPMQNLKILNLDNCEIKDFAPLYDSNIIHVIQYPPSYDEKIELLSQRNKNISVNQLDLPFLYEYFYGPWGSIFNTRFGKENFDSDNLINRLSNLNSDMSQMFNSKVRHYQLSEHTKIVCNQFEKYFCVDFWQIDPNLFRVFLALHDIGKPSAHQNGNKGNQYSYTQEIIKSIWNELPFNSDELTIVLTLSSGDHLGDYFQGKISLDETRGRMRKLAEEAKLDLGEYLKIWMIYYQCDTASYTADAGGLKFLEHLFIYDNQGKVFDQNEGLLKMSSVYSDKYSLLKESLLQ